MPRRSPSELIFLRADIRHFSLKKKKKHQKTKTQILRPFSLKAKTLI